EGAAQAPGGYQRGVETVMSAVADEAVRDPGGRPAGVPMDRAFLAMPAPCDECPQRLRCAMKKLACAAFKMFCADEWQPRWSQAPRVATRELCTWTSSATHDLIRSSAERRL